MPKVDHEMNAWRERAITLEHVLRGILRQADGSLVGTGYQRGGGNVVMVLECSVNHVLDAREVLLNRTLRPNPEYLRIKQEAGVEDAEG